MIVALASIRPLTNSLGTDRFGILTLAWIVVGYFTLFDLGLGRALTQVLAERIGRQRPELLPRIIWTALALMSGLGILGVLALGVLAPVLAEDVLKVPPELRNETALALGLLAISVPLVILTSGLRGILEAYQRFDVANYIRIPSAMFLYAGPLLVLPFSDSLVAVISVLVLGRLATFVVHVWMCFRIVPNLRGSFGFDRAMVRPLFRIGTWMTISNIISPIMVSADRFVIAALISVSAVAYYATAYEFVTKLWLIPIAIIGVLFPAFSTSYAHDPGHTRILFNRTWKLVLVAVFPVTLAITLFSYEVLDLWLGAGFAQHSFRVLQLLTVGVFFNCIAQVPYGLLQGIGRPDLSAKTHLGEAPLYVVGLLWLVTSHGIQGAALAWSLRVTADCAVLFLIARHASGFRTRMIETVYLWVCGAVLFSCMFADGLVVKMALLVAISATFSFTVWFGLLTVEDRRVVSQRIKIAGGLGDRL